MTDAPIETTQPTSTTDINAILNSEPSDAEKAIDAEIAQIDPSSPEAKAAAEKPEKAETPERISKIAAARFRAEKQAKQALQRAQAIEAEKKALEAKLAEYDELLPNLKTKEGLQKLLAKAGLDFNALVEAQLGLPPQPKDTVDEIADLKRQIADITKQYSEERETLKRREEEMRMQESYRQDYEGVAGFVKQHTDKFELVAEHADKGAINEVIKRATKLLADNQVTTLTESERVQLLDYFCQEVEDELFNMAKHETETLAARLKAAKKTQALLSGITSHNTSEPHANMLTNSPDSLDDIVKAISDTTSAKANSKFLTNESTLSAPPISAHSHDSWTGSEDLDRIVEQIRREQQSR